MKNLLIAIVMCLTAPCYSQAVKITKKDSTAFETKIGARTKTTLWITKGSIDLKDIAAIAFEQQGISNSDQTFYKVLQGQNIKVTFDHVKGDTTPSPFVSDAAATPASSSDITQLTKSLEEFRNARQPAKAMELVGILAVGGSIIMQSIYNKQFDDDISNWKGNGTAPKQKNVSPIIPAVGLGFFTIGLGLDLGAGAKLKLKR